MFDHYIPYDPPYVSDGEDVGGGISEDDHELIDHTGIPGVGGGSVPNSHLLISSDVVGESLDSATPFFVPFNNPNVFSIFEQRGTDITWSGANPTRVTINTTGVYDISVGTLFIPTSLNVPDQVQIELYVNGVIDLRNIVFSGQHQLTSLGVVHIFNNTALGWAFDAGDYIELVVGAADAVAGPDVAVITYGAISVTRRV